MGSWNPSEKLTVWQFSVTPIMLSNPGVISGGVCKVVEQIAFHFHTVVANPYFQLFNSTP